MTGRAKTDYEWTKGKVDRLREIAGLVAGVGPAVVYEEGAWTVLKLLALFDLHGVYLPLMRKQQLKGRTGRLFYIDLNSGTGIVRIEGTGASLAGSALIAANIHRIHEREKYPHDYDHYVFVEPDVAKAAALRKRLLQWMPKSKFTLIEKGADDAMDEILAMLASRDHYLCVFDPFGFQQGSWASYGRLIEKTARGDLLVNFQTTSVKRTTEANRRKFFGPRYPGDYSERSEDEILQSFKGDCLRPHRPVAEHVRVQGGRGFRYYYDMVYAIALTGGGSPFMNAFRGIAGRVAKLTGDDIRGMLSNQGLGIWMT